MKSEPLSRFALERTRLRWKRIGSALKRASRRPHAPESAHDLRVASRRFLACLQLFEGLFARKSAEKFRKRSRKLLDRCAAKRTYDVALQVLAEAGLRPHHSVVMKIRQRQAEESRALAAHLAKKNVGVKSGSWMGRWKQYTRLRKKARGEWQWDAPVSDNARHALPQFAEKFFAEGDEAVNARGDYETLHEFRLCAKRFRYSLEVFDTVHGSAWKEKLRQLRELQERIGAINDCVVVMQLSEMDRGAIKAVQRLLVTAERRFREFWKKTFSSENREQWLSALGRGESPPKPLPARL